MSIEIKPCPWCGGKGHQAVKSVAPSSELFHAWIECRGCRASGPIGKGEPHDTCLLTAVQAWNRLTRPILETGEPVPPVTTAEVVVRLELIVRVDQVWGGDCPTKQVHRQAIQYARDVVEKVIVQKDCLRIGSTFDTRVIMKIRE